MDEQISDRIDAWDAPFIALDNRIAALVRQRDELHEQIATLLQRCSDLVIARDAWRETALCETALRARVASNYVTILAADATNPGPTLVAETKAVNRLHRMERLIDAPSSPGWPSIRQAMARSSGGPVAETKAAFPQRALRSRQWTPVV